MSDSETSSEMKIKYENHNGDNLLEDKQNNKKVLSSDTDYYFNIIANPSKIIKKSNIDSESSGYNNIINENDSESNSSKSSHKSNSSSKSSRKSDSSSKSSSKSYNRTEKIEINSPSNRPSFIPPPVQFQPVEQKVKELTPAEVRMKKIEMLRKLSELKSRGFQLSKDYDFNSSLEEMEYEYDLLKSFADKRNGVKIFKSGLLQFISLVEFLNDKYDPFDFHLSGWGDHMQLEAENWDDVLEEIYEKYKGSGKKIAPEVRLLLLIVASASAFHFTKSQSSKLPGLDSLLTSNPGLLSKIINPKNKESSQFMTPQEMNIEKQREEIKKQTQSMNKGPVPMNREPASANKQTNIPPSYTAFGNDNSNNNAAPKIRAPDKVKDILNRIHNLQPNNINQNNTETQDESSVNNDRIVSDSTISETNSKRKYNKKTSKNGISIF